MKKKVDIDVEITPEEMVQEMWDYDCEQQAQFLSELARLYKYNLTDFLAQLEYVSDELDWDGVYNRAEIVKVLETILEYIKGGETT